MCSVVGLLALGGCNVNVAGTNRPIVRRERIRGQVDLVAENRRDDQNTAGVTRKYETTEFEQRVRLQTQGDIYHSDLLSYNAAVGLGLRQDRFDVGGDATTVNGTLDEYSVSGELLREKTYPVNFHLEKSDELIPRQFASSLRSERQGSGALLRWRSKDWPMRFQYSQSQTRQEGQGLTDRDPLLRNDKRFRYSLDHNFNDLSSLSYDFQSNDVQEVRAGTAFNRKEDVHTLWHRLPFGRDQQHRIDSFVDFFDQSGDFEFERLLWQERLRLRHSKTFETNYDFSFNESARPKYKNSEFSGKAGFTHRLFQSLVTTGNVRGSQADLGDGVDLTRLGTGVAFDYRKKNPLGTLLASYGIDALNLSQTGGSVLVAVVDERHPFELAGSLRIRLDRTNVDASSIVVMSADRTRVYSDYTVSQISGLTEINVIPGGDVTTDGDQTLSIDYDSFTEPQRDETALVQSLRVRERFRGGMSVYYEYRNRAEQLSSTDTAITPDEFQTNVFGADYVNKGLRLLAEYGNEESTRVPSESTRLEGSYLWRLSPDTRASVYASNSWIDYTPEVPYNVTLLTVGGSVSGKLTKTYSIHGNVDYRDENDTRQGITRGFEWDVELRYTYRQLNISTGIEFDSLDRLGYERKDTFIYFRLKRFF